jgi:hypothetical protein
MLITGSYWDEKHDAGKLEKSIIHDPVYGFGGNGAPPQGCIQVSYR